MKHSRKANKAGKAMPRKSETRTTAPTVSGPKIKNHKQGNDSASSPKGKARDSRSEVVAKAKGPKVGLPFHTTSPELIAALTVIRDELPGCTARIQEARLEKAIRRWSLTSFEMLKHLDLYDPRARVQGLRLKGLVINRIWVLIETDCGQVHRVGRYALQRGRGVKTAQANPQTDLFTAAAEVDEGVPA